MKSSLLAAAVATLLLSLPTVAQTNSRSGKADLGGEVIGTLVSRAKGEVQVLRQGGQQVVRFDQRFTVASQPGSEVRHIDRDTGKVTLLGYLKNDGGSQSYPVPKGLLIDDEDSIVIYSPKFDEDLATVELSE